MKRYSMIFPAALLAFLFTSCLSSGKAALLAQKDPIALVSIVSNGDINWKGEEPMDPEKAGPLARRTLRSDPDMAVVSSADELIVTAEKLFREQMEASGIINLAEKERVFQSQAYQEAEINNYQINREEVKPDDYRYVDYRDKEFPNALAAETGIKRTMYLVFNLTKSMKTGIGKIGSCQAELEMTVTIMDDQRKTLYKKLFTLRSRDTIKVTNGVYSQTGLTNLFESAIIDVCYEFTDDLSN